MCLIEFGMRFVDSPQEPHERKKDAALSAKLKEVRSGILAWLVRGCLEWQKVGLALPASILLATSRYPDEEDRLLLFIQECCIVAPELWVRAGALYEAYKAWCEENQFGRGMNGKLFGDEMSRRFENKRTNAAVIYQGIGLRSSSPDL